MAQTNPDPQYETFVRLFVAHEARLRGFLRTLLHAWEDVDDVLQETSLVAWRKFDQFTDGSNFMAWIATIGRFEALGYARTKARDRLVFSSDVLERIADEALDETDQREREHQALRRCLDKLDAKQAKWLELAYQPGIKMHEAASQVGKSTQAFYKIIQRLRSTLQTCMTRELNREEGRA